MDKKPVKDGGIPHARRSGNPADEVPRPMRQNDKAYIDGKLKNTFIKGHAMNVHRSHMDLVHHNAQANKRRKIP
jgi:hypothetical protein